MVVRCLHVHVHALNLPHLHGVVHPRPEDSRIVVSKLQIHRAVDQPEGVAFGNLSATPTLLHFGNQLDGGTDTEWIIAITDSVEVGASWNPDRVTTVRLKLI